MDNLSKALLAGIASGVWFIAVLGGYAWSMYRVKTDPLSYYGDETLVFLGIPFVMMTSFFFQMLVFLARAGKCKRKKEANASAEGSKDANGKASATTDGGA